MGRVGPPHGVKGEVKVIPETDDPERFGDLERVFVGPTPEAAQEYRVASVRYQHSKRGVAVVLKLDDVDTVAAAEALRRLDVYADDADLPLDEDEFFLHDLIGLDVVTEEGEPVGVVADVLAMPAQNVYVVRRDGRPDALIPAVGEIVRGVDLDTGRLVIRPIEGLLE